MITYDDLLAKFTLYLRTKKKNKKQKYKNLKLYTLLKSFVEQQIPSNKL